MSSILGQSEPQVFACPKCIDKNHEDLKQSRSRILKASIIYGVTIIAWPVGLVIIARVMALLAAS